MSLSRADGCLTHLQLFAKSVRQFEKLRKRNAFLEQYRKERMFSDGLEELDNSREVVDGLIDEYKAAETADYVNWGSKQEKVPTSDETDSRVC